MANRYFIGVDVSTTASKALAIDEQGQVVATFSYPHALSTPYPLWSEQDPLDWWGACGAAVKKSLTAAHAKAVFPPPRMVRDLMVPPSGKAVQRAACSVQCDPTRR